MLPMSKGAAGRRALLQILRRQTDAPGGGGSCEHPAGAGDQAGERTETTSELAAAGEAAAQPELPPEETAPAEAGEMPVPAAAPAPPAPELRFRDVPEEMERPARTEPEDLVFDLDQILREIAPADAAEPKSGETAPSAEEKEPLWFDPDEVSQPAAVVENAEPAPEAAPLESSVAPEQGEAAAVPAELRPQLEENRQNLRLGRFLPRSRRRPLMGELPASKPETELPAAEQKENAAALEKQTGLHAEQRASLPVEEYRPEQNEEPAAPTGLKPQVSVDGSAVEVSQNRGKAGVIHTLAVGSHRRRGGRDCVFEHPLVSLIGLSPLRVGKYLTIPVKTGLCQGDLRSE